MIAAPIYNAHNRLMKNKENMKTVRTALIEHIAVNIILNFFIAYGLTSLTLEKLTTIPMKAPVDDAFAPNMGGDILVGTFITGVILTLVFSFVVRLQHKIKPMDISNINASSWGARLPNLLFFRALAVGFMSALVVAMPVLIMMDVLSIKVATSANYIFYHALYVALLSGLITYFVSTRAMLDLSDGSLTKT